ncbi:MAG: hypothetical protein NVSMB64_09660 [Candidatus Velthaea sp.]
MEAKRVESARAINPGAILRLEIPPDPRFGSYVRNQVSEFAASLVIVDDDLQEFLTAIGEAFANSIEHAKSKSTIEISCWLSGDDELMATVVDNGVGFSGAEKLLIEAQLPDDLAERGRGLAIMHRCTDIFTVRSTPGKGTAVVLGRSVRRRGRG